MKAWILNSLGGALNYCDVESPAAPAGGVVVRMSATPLLSYIGAYIRGELPSYVAPALPFTPGTNGVGRVETVGPGVYHFQPGDRVAVNPLFSANEVASNPEQILIGLTQISPNSAALMRDWPNGTLRELATFPASCLVPVPASVTFADQQLATLGKFIVPLGGLRRGALSAGETLIVHGATGYFGSAAVLLALALGANRVIAAGRNAEVLQQLVAIDTQRVAAVTMSGDVEIDAQALREAAGGSADVAFDIVGQAKSANGTLASLRGLRRGGRMVVMGSLEPELTINYNELMLNNWSVIGQFMYDRDAYPALLRLLDAGLLNLSHLNIASFPLAELPAAMEQAATMRGLDATVVTM